MLFYLLCTVFVLSLAIVVFVCLAELFAWLSGEGSIERYMRRRRK